MVVKQEDDSESLSSKQASPLPSSASIVKSKTYYGGKVITCLSSLFNTNNNNHHRKALSDHELHDHENVGSCNSEIVKFEFIGAEVKLKKSNLLQMCSNTNSNVKKSVNFVDTVVVKEYPSLDFVLDELSEALAQGVEVETNFFLVNFVDYEKTITRRLEQEMLEHVVVKNEKTNDEMWQREPSLDDVKAASTVNKMINKYKEMIESRAIMINGLKKSI
jgi:hypothetical protein